MTRAQLNHFSLIFPMLLSAIAFLLVIANIAAGVPRQADEDASAHVFQLLIVLEVPIIGYYLATADWRSARPLIFFGLQLAAIAVALFPVWAAGY